MPLITVATRLSEDMALWPLISTANASLNSPVSAGGRSDFDDLNSRSFQLGAQALGIECRSAFAAQ
jgi:hypothetical protein